MHRDVRMYLDDMLESAQFIKQYLTGFPTLSAYTANRMARDAVERRLAIIGEALNKANKINQALLISDKAKIIGLRHILVHDYDKAVPDRIWVLCHAPLDKLIIELENILGDFSLDDSSEAISD